MERDVCISCLAGDGKESQRIAAARRLSHLTEDPEVMDALCATAVRTVDYRLREVLIGILKASPAGASMRFIDYAMWASIPAVRQFALLNLSLLECRDAKFAVINGLRDPDASVRRAAALNAGLYKDQGVINALEHYFERHRFSLTASFAKEGIWAFLKNRSDSEDDDKSEYSMLCQEKESIIGGLIK